jgi:S1-C subfamily serine protease
VVKGTNVSDEVLLELSLEMPRLTIQRRGPARLGVKSNEGRAGCVITGVEPGSAAERAGLQAEDLIVEIDGQEIETFKSLVDVIEKKEPGNQVPIVFIRGDKSYNVVAELLPWR